MVKRTVAPHLSGPILDLTLFHFCLACRIGFILELSVCQLPVCAKEGISQWLLVELTYMTVGCCFVVVAFLLHWKVIEGGAGGVHHHECSLVSCIH